VLISGDQSIATAKTLFCVHVPPNSVVAGHPARVICTLEEYEAKCRAGHIEIPNDRDAARLVVVTSRPALDGVRTAGGLDEALEVATADGGEVVVAGGASIYDQAIPRVDRMLLSTIRGEYDGDTRFPEFDEAEWRVERVDEHKRYVLREWVRR